MAARPRIITARSIGLAFQNLFGDLGPEVDVTGHYSAGGRARTWQEAVARAQSFHADHKAKGWGGIGYHFVIADDGALICARPTLLKGAHTAVHNTQNLGINCPGTTGDRPTSKQQQTYRWLLANAHTAALPQAHRTDRDLRQARLHGHKEWPDNATACPGLFLGMYKAGLGRAEPELEEAAPEAEPAPREPTMHGTTEADHLHLSAEEAEQARNMDEVEEELPEADPEFDDELEDLLTRAD